MKNRPKGTLRSSNKSGAKTSNKTSGGAGWMKRGSAISRESERLAAEAERKSEQRKRTGGIDPNRFRFRLTPGDSCEIVVLDETLESVAFYEHNIKKDGHYGNFESCPSEWSNCPLCSAGDNKYFVWFLTILDLRGYEKDDGTEVPYSRRLLAIKQTQAVAFKRVLQAAMKAHGTTRGVKLTLERDTSDKSASIGEPVINEDGQMFEFLDEDELIEEYGHAAIKSSKTGDVLVKKNGLLDAFDYETLFPKPDAKDIARRWGMSPQAGSDDDYEDESEDLDDEDENDTPVKRKPSAKSKVKPKSKSRVADDDDEDEEDEDEDDEDDFDDEDDDDFDDEDDSDEDEDEDDDDEDEDEDDEPRKKSVSRTKVKPSLKKASKKTGKVLRR